MGKRAKALLRERMARVATLTALAEEQRRERRRWGRHAALGGLVLLVINAGVFVWMTRAADLQATTAFVSYVGVLASILLVLVAVSLRFIDDNAVGPPLIWKPVLVSLLLAPLGLVLTAVAVAQWPPSRVSASDLLLVAAALLAELALMWAAVGAFRLFTQMERRHREQSLSTWHRANGEYADAEAHSSSAGREP